jgi:hypothetical protein
MLTLSKYRNLGSVQIFQGLLLFIVSWDAVIEKNAWSIDIWSDNSSHGNTVITSTNG